MRLDHIVYHEELGSIGDKVRRICATVKVLSELVNAAPKERQTALRIAEIAKFDLVTQIVGEFTELQGTMGEVYAELAGEAPEVAAGIKEHYRPRFSGDESLRRLRQRLLV